MSVAAADTAHGYDTTISGTVERVIYKSDTYHVFALSVGRKEEVVVTGHVHALVEGARLSAHGKWVTHKRFGRQFAMDSCEIKAPTTRKGVEAYLAGGIIKGIGPATAKKIVGHFGAEALKIIRETPERLTEIPGIGPKKAEQLKESIEKHKDIENIMVALQGYGVSTAYATRIYKHFGAEAVKVLAGNPYQLTQVHGIGFLTADKIAKNQDIPDNDPNRVRAGLLYVLEQAASNGHVCLPHKDLCEQAAQILGCTEDDVTEAALKLLEKGDMGYRFVDGANWYYLPALYASEKGIVSRINWIHSNAGPLHVGKAAERALREAENGLGIQLAPQQREAVLMALRGGVMVITGGPGTGKTTITRTVVDIFEGKGRKVVLAAPTGRAAKRLAESTGRNASTIHRLLEWDPKSGTFTRDDKHPLKCDLLVVDEASMLDTYLAYQLLRAVPDGASVLLVGDVDQLPSVGPGRVLNDIIESGTVPVVRLTEIFRQAQGSLIIRNAHRINQGVMPLSAKDFSDPDMFFVAEEDPEKLRELILDIVCRRIPARYGYDPIRDIQLLAPMRQGPLGIQVFNQELQATLNPPMPGKPGLRHMGSEFRAGDKVMQIRNNYEKMVFNGDIGFIVDVDPEDRKVVIEYDGLGPVPYDADELDEIVHSYAVSVHKSQGSEFPVVVMPVHTSHFIMLQRNLLYTGVTRGKNLVVLAGTKKALAIAVKNNTVPQRHSHLRRLLEENSGKRKARAQLSFENVLG